MFQHTMACAQEFQRKATETPSYNKIKQTPIDTVSRTESGICQDAPRFKTGVSYV